MEQRPKLDIGGRVKLIRSRNGLSLEALARTSGVSKAMLSQIEQNKANPTVAVLYKISTALNMDISELLDAPRPKRLFNVIRSDEERYIFISNENCTIRTLSPLALEKDIEFYEISLHRGGALESDAHYQGTEEFLTVPKGRVELISAGEKTVLRAGDSAHYAADVPHSIRNLNRSTTTAYLLVKYRVES